MSSNNKPLEVKCPTCQKNVTWKESSTFRPFCSERCQQVDLGAWSTEAYAIPAEPVDEWSENQLHSADSDNSSNALH